MKRLSFLPLLCTLFAGCSAPAAQNTAAPETPDENAVAVNTAEKAAAPTEAPAKTYVVRDLDKLAQMPGTSPAYIDALKKVVVPPPPLDTKIPDKVKVVLETTRGPITLELNSHAAPLHVRAFVYLTNKGYYDGTIFHRWADLSQAQDGSAYIIQGGDPLTKTSATKPFAGGGGPGYQIPREYNDLKHDKLVVAMAREQDPDSAGSQFYITQAPVYFLDELGYTVFGKVVGGQDAAMKLRKDDKIKTAKVVEDKKK